MSDEKRALKAPVCPYCTDKLVWVSNEEIYGKKYGKSYMVWLCKKCDAYVGCHNNTTKPLGTLANKQLRSLRKKAHDAFNPLYLDFKSASRKKEYAALSAHFGKEMHIGECDEDTCNKVIEYSKKRYLIKREQR